MTTTTASLDPATWPDFEVNHHREHSTAMRSLDPEVKTYRRAVVIGSTGPFAQYAGRKALEAGGNAVDAAIVVSLTQIALAHGGWVSYAGLFSAVHHDGATGKISSLSSGFRTFREEDEPATIPTAPTPSGRTALVPGFFRGAEALHAKHGRLPWADLFLPAIHVAETGFLVGFERAALYQMRKDVLLRTPEGREQFTIDGAVPKAGDRILQPHLAETLRAVARDGADHIYTGPWAERFVEIVRREGGKVVLEDLREYEPIWAEPITAEHNGFTMHAVGAPDTGGAALAEGLNVVDQLGIGDPTKSGEELHKLLSVMRTSVGMTNAVAPLVRATPEHAAAVAAAITEHGGPVGPAQVASGTHSDFVAVADDEGNLITLTHSINTSMWGSTGIFVDGISIPDAACFQQQVLAGLEPGAALPMPTNPAIFTRDGKPAFASTSIGAGLAETTLQCVLSVMRGATVEEAVSQPFIHNIDLFSGDSVTSAIDEKDDENDDEEQAPKPFMERLTAHVTKRMGEGLTAEQASAEFLGSIPQVVEDGFDAAVLDRVTELGINVLAKSTNDPSLPRGYWGTISIDPTTGAKTGARTNYCTGLVEGL